MRRHQKKKKCIIALLLLTFLLSIDHSYAKNGKWKPGNENDRRFPINRTLQIHKTIPIERTLQNDRKNPIDRTLQNDRRTPNDRTLQNFRKIPIDRTLQNDRRILFDRTLQNDRRIPFDRTLQNDRRIPFDRTLQNDKRISIDRTLQNDKRIPFDRTLQTDRRISIDRTLQNDRRIPIDRILQNDRRIPTYKTKQPDGLMQKDKRLKINKILEQDRRSHNELKKKINRLLQNENLQVNKRVRDGGRMLNTRRMQKDGKIQNNLTLQNTRRSLDEHLQKMINARRTGDDKSFRPNFPPNFNDRPNVNNGKSALSENISSANEVTPAFGNLTDEVDTYTTEEDDPEKHMWQKIVDAWKRMTENIEGYQPSEHGDLKIRACACIATTFISAHQDFKRYYERRYLYQNSIEFEVGYVVSEIISKYQRMLELYNMAIDYYFSGVTKNYIPNAYMLYMYTNVLEMGTVITHLCNMLAEIEDKYVFMPAPWSGFSDYHHILMSKTKDDPEVKMAREAQRYDKIMKKILSRQKKKQRKKKRAKDVDFKATPSTPVRRPRHRSWPIIYGWSIEYYW